MPSSRPFGATNEPDTCLWCGRKLRIYLLDRAERNIEQRAKKYVESEQKRMLEREQERKERVAKNGQRRGDYGDGFFCGLRCGYEFGLCFAQHHHQLQPKLPKVRLQR